MPSSLVRVLRVRLVVPDRVPRPGPGGDAFLPGAGAGQAFHRCRLVRMMLVRVMPDRVRVMT